MDAIKLEGGSPSRITAAKAIGEAGIAIMGHVGLTPQAISVLGGFRPQGKNVASAVKVVETALALQEASWVFFCCFGMCACTCGCCCNICSSNTHHWYWGWTLISVVVRLGLEKAASAAAEKIETVESPVGGSPIHN